MMKKTIAPLLLLPLAIACDESKYDKYKTPEASASVAVALPTTTAAPSVSAAAVTWKKKSATDCKPHAVDFGDDTALEAEVRRKLGKDAGAVTEHDLGTIRSINLSTSKTIHQIDPCIFPMFTSLKDLFLGPGDYDDLTPLAKLSTIESLRLSLSSVKDLHAIEGLKRMDRLDLAHTLVGDEELKSVGGLVNITELMLDEDNVTDIAPVANLKKLERLSIKKTGVKSLAPLSQIKTMKFLYIADTPITDITPVQPLMSGGMKLITTNN